MDDHVWARVGHGRTRRMLRSEAALRGLEIDTREPLGFGAGVGVRREFMGAAERREIFAKTGTHVESHSDRRAVYKAKGLHDAEKGEACHAAWDAALDAANRGAPIDPIHGHGSIDMWGDEARRKPMNADAAIEFHRARIARGEPFRESGL